MLDPHVDQGAGLRCQTPQAAPRLAALAGHGDVETELPLLWELCSALQAQGYRVAVLDTTAHETEQSPGLQDLLDGGTAPEDGWDYTGDPGLCAFPAAGGLATLADASGKPRPAALPRLARALRCYDVAILYGGVPLLVEWARHCAITPVLATAPRQAGVLAAYRSLKSLCDAGVVPTVASVVTRPGIATAGSAEAARTNLAQCAQTWLGRHIDVLRVRASLDSGTASAEIHRLALRLVEGAATLAPEPFLFQPPATGQGNFDRPARSH
jgi:hypothetical protein